MVDLDNLDELIDEMKQGNAKYLLVNVIARRVRAYGRGDRPQVEGDPTMDPADIAIEELRRGKLKLLKEEPEEPMIGVREERDRDAEEEE